MAMNDLARMSAALEQFRLDVGRYPTTAEGLNALLAPPPGVEAWRGPYIDRLTRADPFGNPYWYADPSDPASGTTGYVVTAAGLDGRLGTADDYRTDGRRTRR